MIANNTASFNGIVVDATSNTITYSTGKTVDISYRLIEILFCLIEKPGEVVSYDELAMSVWGEKAASCESAIYQQIALLRKVFRDEPSTLNLIKTVPKKGYVFTGKLDEAALSTPTKGVSVRLKGWVALFILIAFVGVAYFFVPSFLDATKMDENVSYLDRKTPKAIVAIQSHFDIRVGGVGAGVLAGISHLIKTHIEINGKEIHATPVSELVKDKRLLRKHFEGLADHIYFIESELIRLSTGRLQLDISLVDLVGGSNESLVSLQFEEKEVYSVIYQIEEQVVNKLKQREFLSSARPFLNRSSKEAKVYVEGINAQVGGYIQTRDLESSIEMLNSHLLSNPKNVAAHSAMWGAAISRLDRSYRGVPREILRMLKVSIEQVLNEYPTFRGGLYAKAESVCREDGIRECKESINAAILGSEFDYGSYGTIQYYKTLEDFQYLAVSRLSYRLNPFVEDNFLYYYNDLLSKSFLNQAIDLLVSNVALTGRDNSWHLLSKLSTNKDDIKAFKEWYDNARLENLSKYTGYMMLNANEPVLARYIMENGSEDLPYFDIMAIEIFANIWESKWDSHAWQTLYKHAAARKQFQNIMDKFYIAYFFLMDGNYLKAQAYLEEVYPQLMSDEIDVNIDNFRYFVYYNETLKQIGNFRKSNWLTGRLDNFLEQKFNSEQMRNVNFGLSNVEFYALNGNEEKAELALDYALNEQGWLPNANWMWPPVEANIFLKNLATNKSN